MPLAPFSFRREAPPEVRDGTFVGGLPYLAVGFGQPLVYLCGSTPNHRNPKPGLERRLSLLAVLPLARAGFEIYYVNRWPGMTAETTFAEVAARHADALTAHFGAPVDVLGHSTGGSLALQLIADRPEVVRRCVVASAAYALGPVAKRAQLAMLHGLERTGRLTASAMAEGMQDMSGLLGSPFVRGLLWPVLNLAAARITIENPVDTAAMLRAEDAFDVYDRLPGIQTPTLVVHGGRDHFWTPEMFTETAARLPHAELISYPNLGHAITTDRRFVDDVRAFLAAPGQ